MQLKAWEERCEFVCRVCVPTVLTSANWFLLANGRAIRIACPTCDSKRTQVRRLAVVLSSFVVWLPLELSGQTSRETETHRERESGCSWATHIGGQVT